MKKRISYYVAAIVGKAMIHGMHLMKRNATNLPGEVALQLCPSLLANFQMPKHVIVVTGTNGKTTVTNLIGNVLKKCGNDIITNAFGGNVDTGIASLLLANSKLNGTLTADTLLLEMDERSAQRILPYVKPDYLVCTNLQRDSMKRNAHVEFIFDFLNRNIPEKRWSFPMQTIWSAVSSFRKTNIFISALPCWTEKSQPMTVWSAILSTVRTAEHGCNFLSGTITTSDRQFARTVASATQKQIFR